MILWAATLSLPAGFAAGRDFPVAAFRATPVEVFTAVVLRAVVVPAAGLPGVVLRDVIVPVVEPLDEDFPDAAAALPADAWPVVFFATAALPAGWRAPDFTAGLAGAVLPAFALVPAGAVAPVDFVDLPAPLPRDVAFLRELVAVVAGFCRDFSSTGALLARVVVRLAAFAGVLLAAVVVVFLAAGLLAPVVLPAAFRGLVVAMRFSRRGPLRCMPQRRPG